MPIFCRLLRASSLVFRQKVQFNRLIFPVLSHSASSHAFKMDPKFADQVHSTHSVIKSDSDKNEYRGLLLKNGMKVLVISDATTDKSAAALNVQVGCMTDPREIPGLAHFCEHMLFMGTKKYPPENYYHSFLSNHGGLSNAHTALDNTCYYFDVTPEHFKEASDIFAQFFISPIFDQSCTDREIQAVNSEYEKNIKQDLWRMWHLDGVTGNPNHDFSKFGTGNRETLQIIPKEKGIDIRQALLDFHSKYYSSNIMSVCLLGKENLDDLSNLAIELFGCVENKNITSPVWPDHPFTTKELRIQTNIVPVKDLKQIVFTFPVPDSRYHYKTNPGHYVSHLVGHEGEGSLLSYLKKKGWANSLTGGLRFGGRGFSFFTIAMNLSPEGLENTDAITTAVFAYLDMVRQQGPQKWIFEELQNLGAMHFRFKDKEPPQSYVANLTEALHIYDWEDVLSGPYIVSDYKPELINELMTYLTPQNLRITLVSNAFAGKTDRVEKYFGTEYSVSPIPEDKIEAWIKVAPNPELKLPPPNVFIPTNFALAPEEKKFTQSPGLLIDEPSNRVWFLQDKAYNLPSNVATFELRTPLAYNNPVSALLTNLALACFNDANNEYFYSAVLAGLKYSLENNMNGVTLKIRGYNERQQAMLEIVCERLAKFKIDPKRFEVLKESCERRMRNFAAEQPYQHALYYTNMILAEKYWTYEQILAVVEDCTVEKCQAHLEELLKQMYVEALIYGNTKSEEALKMGQTIHRIFKHKPLTFDETNNLKEFKLKEGEIYQFDKQNEVHPTNSVMTYYQVGTLDVKKIRTVALNDLLHQVLDEPSFDVLRTKEQLGYIVSTSSRRSLGTHGLRVIVQSEKNPSFVSQRIDEFINSFSSNLIEKLTEEDLEKHKKALISLKLEKPKRLQDKNNLLWREVTSRAYVFNREQQEADEIAKLTKNDLVEFYQQYIRRGGPKVKQLVVNVESKSNPGEHGPGVNAKVIVKDVDSFKKSHTLFENETAAPKL